jgi:hypothetical protein
LERGDDPEGLRDEEVVLGLTSAVLYCPMLL